LFNIGAEASAPFLYAIEALFSNKTALFICLGKLRFIIDKITVQ